MIDPDDYIDIDDGFDAEAEAEAKHAANDSCRTAACAAGMHDRCPDQGANCCECDCHIV